MKLVLEIVFNDDAMREPTDVCEAIDRINTWPLRFIAGEGALIFDRNGATVGEWKVVGSPDPAQLPVVPSCISDNDRTA